MNDKEILVAKTRLGLGQKQPCWVTTWFVENELENSASIPVTLDGTKHIENIEQRLRPKIRFTFNFRDAEDYAEAERLFVLGTFVCNYYQPAIGKRFTGCFVLNKRQLGLFLMLRGDYKGVTNYQIEAESIYTYDNWEHLTELAEEDNRF